MAKINDTKLRKEKKLEDFRSKIDTEPKMHEFTADIGLQVLFDPNTATLLGFLSLFLTDEFFSSFQDRKIFVLSNILKQTQRTQLQKPDLQLHPMRSNSF